MALWLTLAAPVQRMFGERRPNIIFISIDALRPDFLGAYGSIAGLTPNLDAFAREATVYDAAYAPSAWTLASFGALFTGRPPSLSIVMRQAGEHPTEYVDRVQLIAGVPLLSERLQSGGYRAAAELTNPFLTNHFGWGRGFEYFRNEDAADADLLLTAETVRAEVITQNAEAWVRLNHQEPFFLWVHYLDPHAPYDAPGSSNEARDEYPSEWETNRSYWEKHIDEAPAAVIERYESFCRERYAAEIKYVDRWVGRLLEQIRGSGRYDDSLIAVFSDHGEELFEHGGFDHGHSLHEEVLRVPLIVKWPRGVHADPLVHQTVALMDLNRTVLDLAVSAALKGESVRVLPRADGAPGAEVYSEGLLHTGRQTALTTDEWKVIYTPAESSAEDRFEVYHRRSDRQERRDLADTDAAAGLCARLRTVTEKMLAAQAAASQGGAPAHGPDERARRQLRSLGYLSD
jgi:arylsulfatase A-like enzyme